MSPPVKCGACNVSVLPAVKWRACSVAVTSQEEEAMGLLWELCLLRTSIYLLDSASDVLNNLPKQRHQLETK